MAKLTVKHLGVTSSPTGESWLVRSSGDRAVPLTPNTPVCSTTSCAQTAGGRELSKLLEEKPAEPAPWGDRHAALRLLRAFLPVPWEGGEEPLVYIRGSELTPEDVIDLMALSCQDGRSIVGSYRLRMIPERQVAQWASFSNITPMVATGVHHEHQASLNRMRFSERRSASIFQTSDDLLIIPRSAAIEVYTAQEVKDALAELKGVCKVPLHHIGLAALRHWALLNYEAHQFGVPLEFPWG